tara:strand:- start:1714 stop:2727 length:1014 start_codon:yes stop_codon:yes gene_type:complete
MATKTTPEIIAIKLASLIIDPSLSGRSPKEIKANAAELVPRLKAAQGWNPGQPGAFFTRDGKPHLAAGFSRVTACETLEIKTGYFVEVPDNPSQLRTEAIRSNGGRPISAFEQGRIYADMETGSDPEKLEVGKTALAPMTVAEIAAEVGYSRVHIENCIAIFSETPEIGELLAEGLVSAGVVKSAQVVKADGKRLDGIKAAIAVAKKEAQDKGRETWCATQKHWDQVKADFITPTKLKAAPSVPADDKPKADKKKAASEPAETPESTAQLSSDAAPKEQDDMFAGKSDEPEDKEAKRGEVLDTVIAVLVGRDMEPALAKEIAEELAERKLLADGIPF